MTLWVTLGDSSSGPCILTMQRWGELWKIFGTCMVAVAAKDPCPGAGVGVCCCFRQADACQAHPVALDRVVRLACIYQACTPCSCSVCT